MGYKLPADAMSLGEVIKKYREVKGISQEDFAKMARVSRGYISTMEKNPFGYRKDLNIERISYTNGVFERCAAIMGFEPDELFELLKSGDTQQMEKEVQDRAQEYVREIYVDASKLPIEAIARPKEMEPELMEKRIVDFEPQPKYKMETFIPEKFRGVPRGYIASPIPEGPDFVYSDGDKNYVVEVKSAQSRRPLFSKEEILRLGNQLIELSQDEEMKRYAIPTVPVYSTISFDDDGKLLTKQSGEEPVSGISDNADRYFGFIMKGDSMEPLIKDKSVLIVDKDAHIVSGDVAIVAVKKEEATCKKYVFEKNDPVVTLEPINSGHSPRRVERGGVEPSVKVLGKVIEVRYKL